MNTRNHKKQNLTTRAFAIRSSSFDSEARSVEAVIASEARVMVLDWQRWEPVEEVLLMSGAVFPRQIPFLDSHDRSSITKIIGSVRNIRVENNELVGVNVYGVTEEGEKAFVLARDGHLSTNSIGYVVSDHRMIEPGKSWTYQGRTFTAGKQALRVAIKWEVKESSAVSIPADANAKNRNILELKKMNFTEWLEVRGLDIDTLSEEQKTAFRADFDSLTNGNTGGDDKLAIERKRIADIKTEAYNDISDATVQRCIAEGLSVEDAKAEFLKEVRAGLDNKVGSVFVGDDLSLRDLPSAMADSILTRAGVDLIETDKTDKPVFDADGDVKKRQLSEQGRSLMTCRIPDLARRILTATGYAAADNLSDRQAVKIALDESRAISTLSLPAVLGNTMGRSVLQSYAEYPVQWIKFGTPKSHDNFKEITRIQTTAIETVEQVGEGGEYSYATIGEDKETYKLAKFGKIFGMTWEQLVNDNLHVFTEIPGKLGAAARRIEDVIAFAALLSTVAMNDGKTIFHADHGNLAGSGAAPSVITMNAAKLAFRKQTGIGEKADYLNLTPNVLVVPCELEATADVLYKSKYDPADANGKTDNIWAGKFSPTTHPLLSDSSTAAWYLSTGPGGGGLEVCFLNGQRTPVIEREQGFSIDCMRFKIRHVVAAKVVDEKQFYKNPGA